MNILYDPEFKIYFDALPTDKLRTKTTQKIKFLASNPRHKSLNFKKIEDKTWQFRIDIKYRIWGLRNGNDILLYLIFRKQK